MKPSELRIGNIVFKDGIYWAGMPDGCLSITANGIKQFSDGKLLFEPIPLTEEWMLKFGFEKDEDNRYEDVEISLYTHGSDFIFNRVNLLKSGRWQFVTAELDRNENIQYVHQLQNLYFALTGEELTIKQLT